MIRANLPLGLQLAQACHAVAQLCNTQGTDWLSDHPNLVVLASPHEEALLYEYQRLTVGGLQPVLFWEPDCGSYTALAQAPDARARLLLSDLPLAAKAVADVP